jgi:hypothetical protein
MPSSASLAALSVLPTGAVALLAHNATQAFVVALVGVVLAAVPALADTWMRWQAHHVWLEVERRRLQALDRLDTPDHILDRLPPLAVDPLGRPIPVEGPAPPVAPPG